MKTMMILGATTVLLLSGCSSMGAGPSTVQDEAASLTTQATLTSLAAGKLYCPPFYNSPCGSYAAQGRPRMGGDIIPTLTFTGEKTVGSSLGNSFVANFPSSGYTKFYVSTLRLEVGALDKSLMGQSLKFTFESSAYSQGIYTFTYIAQ